MSLMETIIDRFSALLREVEARNDALAASEKDDVSFDVFHIHEELYQNLVAFRKGSLSESDAAAFLEGVKKRLDSLE